MSDDTEQEIAECLPGHRRPVTTKSESIAMTDVTVTQIDRQLRTLIHRLTAVTRGTDQHDQLKEEIKELKDARRKKLAPRTFVRMLSSLG